MSGYKDWILPDQYKVPEDFLSAIDGHMLVAQTLYQRGYQSIETARAFLNPDTYQPTPADALPDIEKACGLLAETLHQDKRILVWGDFDVDGQTATTILVEGLRTLGGDILYHIPIRSEESHGLNREVLTTYLKQGFDLLITCDTGISEHENIQYTRNANIPVIVTDHHALGETLPPANAVINPQRLPVGHPLHTLPGVGVAYKLIEGLFATLDHRFDPGPLLELAALGIVADLAELHGDTRYLLQKGLLHLRHTRRIGLQNIYKQAGLNPLHLNETHIGFQIAPRLNAVGRLGDANKMIEFLTTQDMGRARVLATQIEAINARRRFATRQVEKGAESQLQSSSEDRHAPAIVLHHPGWPGGVVGIVASRLVERYQKPVILLTGEDPIHGSARSVEGINITKAIASQHDLLIAYGGHPMAAGLSFTAENFASFKRGFLSTIEQSAKFIEITPKLQVNQVLTLDQITLDLIQEVSRLAPFGPGNPPLHFLLKELSLISTSDVGQHGEHRQVIVGDHNENQLRVIWWHGGDDSLPEDQFDLVCKLSQSDYKGVPQISAEWVDFRLSEIGAQKVARRQFEVEDHRGVLSPQKVLKRLLDTSQFVQVWGEGSLSEEVQAVGRHTLKTGGTLIIWTTPPSQSVLQGVVHQTTPEMVILFGLDPNIDNVKTFLMRLAGLVKYAVQHKESRAQLSHLASACATEQETIRIGLQLWEAMGKFEVKINQGETIIDNTELAPDKESIGILSEILKTLLSESRAYRHYFRTCDIHSIFPNHLINQEKK